MGMLSAKLRSVAPNGLMFFCPGCQQPHALHGWQWNGDALRPSFAPSVLCESGHYAASHKPGDPCWCSYQERFGRPSPFKCERCHSFVVEGEIRFLSDCSHVLKSRTVDLPDLPEYLRD